MSQQGNVATAVKPEQVRLPALRVLKITEDDLPDVIEFFRAFFDGLPAAAARMIGVTVNRAVQEPIPKTVNRIRRLYGLRGFRRPGHSLM